MSAKISVVRGYLYRLHDAEGDDLGELFHPAPNLEPGDVVVLADDREALVTARVETESRLIAALLEVVTAPRVSPTPSE